MPLLREGYGQRRNIKQYIVARKYVMDLIEGEKLVGLARKALESAVREEKLAVDELLKKEFSEKRGVFVTLISWPGEELRGCIGFPLPSKDLYSAVIEAAVSAGLNDARFARVGKEELTKIVFEVSVLSEPEEIIVEEEKDLEQIRIGKDGLIVNFDGYALGLLLPQVATEFNMNSREFLEATCEKAGLDKSIWRKASARVYRFQAQIFCEEKPSGKVKEKCNYT